MKLSHNIIPFVLCIIMTTVIAGIYLYERNESIRDIKVYETVTASQEKQLREIEKRKEELAALLEQARENYNLAVETYLPGIAFFGDSLVSDTNNGGMDFRSTVSALIMSKYCSAATAYIDTSVNVNYESVVSFFPIIFMGDNRTDLNDTKALLDRQSMYIGDHDRYIVVGPTRGTKAEMENFEKAMTETYGDRFINLREYMSTDGLPSLELEITNEDRAAMEQGRIPPSLLRSDGLHLNDNGTRLLSYLTVDRMEELGYFDEIFAAKQIYEEEGK